MTAISSASFVSTTACAAYPEAYFDDVRASFDATAEQRAVLFPDQLLVINVDLVAAARAVSETFPRIKMMREDMLTLPKFDIAEIDRIPSYAEALIHANSLYLSAAEPTAQLPAMVARASKFRDQFVMDVRTLAGRNLVDEKRLADLKGGVGYLAIAADLGLLVNILRERWNDIQGRTGVSSAELDEAQRLYPQIILVSDGSAQQAGALKSATDDRARAWTLLANAFEQVRRASAYFRFDEDDTDKIFPSLWAKKGAGRPPNKPGPSTGDAPAPVGAPAAPVGAQPVTPPVTPPAPASPMIPRVDAGFPGTSPFFNR